MRLCNIADTIISELGTMGAKMITEFYIFTKNYGHA